MPRKTQILSISLPANMTKAVDTLSRQTDQTRSELIRNALREYLLDMQEDRERFLTAYQSTRNERVYSMQEIREKYDL